MRQQSSLVYIACASVLMLAGGLNYRATAARYARDPASAPLPAGTLAKLPLQMGDWLGVDSPMEESIVEATDTDDHLSRVYENRAANQAVSLFVGYGIRLRDLTPHRPEVCYPGNGWTADGAKDIEVSLADGSTLACRVLRFRRGGLSNDSVTVLCYYIVDGEYCADVSLLRSKSARADADGSFSVQVQIVSGGGLLDSSAEPAVKAFAAVAAPQLLRLLPPAPPAAGAGTGG